MRVRGVVVAVAVLAAASAAACGSDGPAGGDGGRLRVAAAFYPLADAARRVGGDLVRVVDLTPPGVEPHDLEVTPEQVDTLEDADAVLYVGGGFQPAVEEIAERRDDGALDLLPPDGDDVHFWLDPIAHRDAVEQIAGALARVRPAARATFERNAAAFAGELTALDREIRAALGSCDRRRFVTTHVSFGYFNDRYDLVSASVAGSSPESEPDADRIAELVSFIEQAGITTVFTEPLAPDGIARTLAREAGVDVAVLDPLETRPDDGDYLAVMRRNVSRLADALGCRA